MYTILGVMVDMITPKDSFPK